MIESFLLFYCLIWHVWQTADKVVIMNKFFLCYDRSSLTLIFPKLCLTQCLQTVNHKHSLGGGGRTTDTTDSHWEEVNLREEVHFCCEGFFSLSLRRRIDMYQKQRGDWLPNSWVKGHTHTHVWTSKPVRTSASNTHNYCTFLKHFALTAKLIFQKLPHFPKNVFTKLQHTHIQHIMGNCSQDCKLHNMFYWDFLLQ